MARKGKGAVQDLLAVKFNLRDALARLEARMDADEWDKVLASIAVAAKAARRLRGAEREREDC